MAGSSYEATERSDVSSSPRPGLALRLLLAAVVLVAGLAVASPRGPGEEQGAAVACAVPASDRPGPEVAGVIELPPGHPPIPGMRAQGPAAVRLPPGHPPVDGRQRRLPVPTRPSSPVFQAPATVDL
jgi:hypothetical protein